MTKFYNEYDQHGAYFVAAFNSKPTREQILDVLDDEDEEYSEHKQELVEHLLTGGGRRKNENVWYWLLEVKDGKYYHKYGEKPGE